MKKINLLKMWLLAAVMLLGSASVWGANLTTWTFTGNSGCTALAPSPTAANVTVGSLTAGTGMKLPGSPAGNAWGGVSSIVGSMAEAEAANYYATFTVKANAGYKVSLQEIGKYNIRRSSTGASTGQWQYSLNGGAFTNIGSAITWGGTTSGSGNEQAAIDLSSIAALQNVADNTTITIRLVIWGNTGTGGTWYFNAGGTTKTLTVNGTVESGGPILPDYTITANANNTSLGTVSVNNNIITASPNSCVGYASPAYTVTSGSATVRQSGNTFTVTPSTDCNVRINFASSSPSTVTLNDKGTINAIPQATCTSAVTLPTPGDCGDWAFAGWATASDAETFVTSPYTPTGDITLYAVYKKTLSSGGSVETLITTVGFESAEGFTASTVYNNTTAVNRGATGKEWAFIMGTPTTTGSAQVGDGSQCTQMRSYANNTTKGSVTMLYDLNNITKIKYKAKTAQGTPSLNLYYSTNGGTSWSVATPQAVTSSSAQYEYKISTTGEFANIRIKFENAAVSVATQLSIDDVEFYGMESGGSSTEYSSNPEGCTSIICNETPSIANVEASADQNSIFLSSGIFSEGGDDCVVTEKGFVYSTSNQTPVIGGTGVMKLPVTGEDLDATIGSLSC
ncbi:MAG: InlB B-repeat-containing protein, partial [Prevotellaceae bacterium]|nr:InlB B-repeat-containing protein [Prevotellaceae bacterium]